MAGEHRGRWTAILALLISLIALGTSILASREAGGSRTFGEQLKALQGTLETARKETADTLARIERSVRPPEKTEAAPAQSKR
jgi:hypothetical protein